MDLTTSSGKSMSAFTKDSDNKVEMKRTGSKTDPNESVGGALSQVPASPSYISFDPKILDFYTTEEREKLVQCGFIPARYSALSSQFLGCKPEIVPTGNRDVENLSTESQSKSVISAVTGNSITDRKQPGDSGKKMLNRDKKKNMSSEERVGGKTPQPAGCTSKIPVGIAIAQKRRNEREAQRTSDQNSLSGSSDSSASQDRPTTAVTTSGATMVTSSEHGLSSNLVITGSSSSYWLGHGAYSLPPSSRDGAQLQYNPPPGYKIAGDPITGQLYVIPDMKRVHNSPLPSPRSSIKSDQSMDTSSLELALSPLGHPRGCATPQDLALSPLAQPRGSTTPQEATMSPLGQYTTLQEVGSNLSPRHLSAVGGAATQDHLRRFRRERVTSRDEATRPESRNEVDSLQSRSTQSTPTSRKELFSPNHVPIGRREMMSPEQFPGGSRDSTQTSASDFHPPPPAAMSLTGAHNYPPYYHPYLAYYWGPYSQAASSHLRIPAAHNTAPVTTVTASMERSSPAVKAVENTTSRSTAVTTNKKAASSKKNTMVQTVVTPVVDSEMQTTIEIGVEIGVQTDDDVTGYYDNTGVLFSTSQETGRCGCKCHLQGDKMSKQPSALDNLLLVCVEGDKQLPLASPNSTSDPRDTESLDILGALCAREAKLSPPGVGTVYNGPRAEYVSDVVGQRRKSPVSPVSRFESMDVQQLEMRKKLSLIQQRYKQRTKELDKLKPKKESDRRRSVGSRGSRRSSKSLSDCDPLSPKSEPLSSPKPVLLTKAQRKEMPNQPIVGGDGKDSDVEELRSMLMGACLEGDKDGQKERNNIVPKTNDDQKPLIFSPPTLTSLYNSKPNDSKLETKVFVASQPIRCQSRPSYSTVDCNKSQKRKGSRGSDSRTPSKKRKPGRPKKFGEKRSTETLVSKSSKQFSVLVADDSDGNQGSSTDSDKQDSEAWDRRRSERIFLTDSNKSDIADVYKAHSDKLSKDRRNVNLLSQKLKKKYRSMDSNRCHKQVAETKTVKEKTVAKTSPVKQEPQSNNKVTHSSAIKESDLKNGMRILYFMDGLFYQGQLSVIEPLNVYGINLVGERGNRPRLLPLEDVLKNVFLDVGIHDSQQVAIGARVCAYWSHRFSCMYPGTIVEGDMPLPKTARGRGIVNIEFDDGDTGKMSVELVKLLPQDFPIQDDSDSEDESPCKRRKSQSEELLADSWRERRPVKIETVDNFQVQCKQVKKNVETKTDLSCDNTVVKTPTKSKKVPARKSKMASPPNLSSEIEEKAASGSGKKTGSPKIKKSRSKSRGSSDKNYMDDIPPEQVWQWVGEGSEKTEKKVQKTLYQAITRDGVTISVGDCAHFFSMGSVEFPYIGRIECFYENRVGHRRVKVRWFYHPPETKGGKKLAEVKGALYESEHCDENSVQSIMHKVHIMSYTRYKSYRIGKTAQQMAHTYYLAGFYDPTNCVVKPEGDVKLL